jgi:type II secretory pathway predicted ATPase ExeA/septal ring-binding cell division protein DamX
MYLEHFGLNEAPFKITPHTEFFFDGANRGETLEALLYAITSGEGMVKVTGEVGAGKTMLCRVLMERLPETVETIYLAVPSLSRDEMLAVIAGDLGLEVQGGNTTKLMRALQERLVEIHLEGKQVVALIDEAHAMPVETLEEIRLLSNLETSHDKLMQIVLFGQPELDQTLVQPNMRQLKERITHSFNLLPLPARDIKDYLNFRLRAAGYKGPDLFGADALKLIAEASEGLTRRINIYADKTLLAAYAAGTHTITPDLVRAAITDTQIVLPASASAPKETWRIAALALALGIGAGFAIGRFTAPDAAVPSLAIKPQVLVPTSVTPAATGSIAKAAEAPPVAAPKPVDVGQATPGPISPVADATKTPEAPAANPSATVAGAPVGQTKPAAETAKAANPSTVSAATAAPETKVIEPAAGKDWLGTRMAADVARLAALPADRYAIQLMTADQREKAAIESFLRAAAKELNPDKIMVYPSGTADNPRVSVLYGQFPERADATNEQTRLSPRLTQFRPYVRSIQAVRDDIRPGS